MTTEEAPTFGDLLSHYRVAVGLTQEELAERADLSARGISDLERGVRTRPQPLTVRQLAEALQLSSNDRAIFEEAAWTAGAVRPADHALPEGNFLGALPSAALCAREEEVGHICSILDVVAEGSGHTLFLSGELGVGKTRLLQALMVEARVRDYLILTGRCDAAEQKSAYFPFMEALGGLTGSMPSNVRSEGRRAWARIQQLTRANGEHADIVEQQQLFSAVSDLLLLVSRSVPVALLLDDLHWADSPSLKLLQHLTRTTRNARILLAAAFRELRLTEEHPDLARTLQTLSRQRLAERITVRRLSLEETTALVAVTMGQVEVSEEFAHFVYRRTKGIPRIVDQLVRSLGGRLELQGEIGAGAMGRVFRAFDRATGQPVAAKLVLSRPEIDLDALLRFQQEGAVLAKLDHPRIVDIHDTFVEEHATCIIMELLEGQSLGQILRNGPLPLSRAKHLALQVAEALSYSHSQSIVHRDIKPDNVMVLENDQVKVTDFGIARILQPDTSLQTIATTGMRMGTPLYMAPEQIEGKKVDGRTDVYALGCVLYHMVTGRPPFEGVDPLTVALEHVRKSPRPPRELNRHLPMDWERLILRAISKDPIDRFQSATGMGQSIAGLVETADEAHRVRARPARAIKCETAPKPELAAGRIFERVHERVKWRLRPMRTFGRGVRVVTAASLSLLAVTVALMVHLAQPPGTQAPILDHIATDWHVQTSTLPFNYPEAVAIGAGVIYVADDLNNRIARLTPTGLALAPWGSGGSDPGQFNHPTGVAVDAKGDVYVADTANNRIQKFSPDGALLAQWGVAGPQPLQLNQPIGVAVDRRGNVYVADAGDNRVMSLSPSGTLLKQWSILGSAGTNARVGGIAVDRHDWVYVTDPADGYIDVFSTSGQLVRQLGNPGLGPEQLNQPAQVAVDSHGDVFVADSANGRIQRFAPDGRMTVLSASRLSAPKGVALDVAGHIYVTDAVLNRLLELTSQGRLLASWTGASAGDIFVDPTGIAVGPQGNLYITDAGHNRILALSPTGAVVQAWGMGGVALGQFSSPHAVTVDRRGNIYVADTFNDRIQKLSPEGRAVLVWKRVGASPFGLAVDRAGDVYIADNTAGQIVKVSSSGRQIQQWGRIGSGPGEFSDPRGLAVDESGRVYVADKGNNRIEIFDSNGNFLGQLGPGGPGSGGTTPGRLSKPEGVAVDSRGSIYIADTDNHRIQQLTVNGHVQAVIGGGQSHPGGFLAPEGVAVSAAGNVFVADGGSNRVQEIVPRS